MIYERPKWKTSHGMGSWGLSPSKKVQHSLENVDPFNIHKGCVQKKQEKRKKRKKKKASSSTVHAIPIPHTS